MDNKNNFLNFTKRIIDNKFNFNINRKLTQINTIINECNRPLLQNVSYLYFLLYILKYIPFK